MSPVKHTAIQAKPTLPKSPQKSHVAHPLQLPPVKSGGKMYGDKDRFAKQRTVSMSEPHVAQVCLIDVAQLSKTSVIL